MLEHQKSILESVSTNDILFRQEIIQSFKWLKSYEIIQLHRWLKDNYSNTHEQIIKEIFQYIAA